MTQFPVKPVAAIETGGLLRRSDGRVFQVDPHSVASLLTPNHRPSRALAPAPPHPAVGGFHMAGEACGIAQGRRRHGSA